MNNITQGFECEIDRTDWLSCQATSRDLTIALICDGDPVGFITIGRGRIQNLIDYLEQAKEVVAS